MDEQETVEWLKKENKRLQQERDAWKEKYEKMKAKFLVARNKLLEYGDNA